MYKHKRSRGFTLVELLIVIVVIAILAAITLVAYNGIRERARNTMTINAAGAWVSLLSASYTLNGTINIDYKPAFGGGVCLGNPADYSGAVGNLETGECFDKYFADQAMYDQLAEVGNASMQPYAFDIGDGQYTRGIQYSFKDDGHAYIEYDLIGTGTDCGIAGAEPPEEAEENTASSPCQIDMTAKLGAQPIDFDWDL